jgi:putative PIN family toxin of toxin-antitoxin system
MKVVVDSSVIFSALLLKHSKIRDILFEGRHHFYCPNYLFVEIFKHKEKILKHSKLDAIEMYEYLNKILENIQFINEGFISPANRNKAFELCKEVDVKDTPFIALAFEFDAYVWTGDRKLRRGLEKKDFRKFVDMESLETQST